MIVAKLLRIRFDKIDRFLRVFDGTRYLVLFGTDKWDFIYSRIRYLIQGKTGITYVMSHNYGRIKVDSCDSFPLEATLTLHNVVTLIKSVFNKDK